MTNRNGSPWSASQALAWIICQEPLKLENQEWTKDMGPEIKSAQMKLTEALAAGQIEAWGRRQPHGLLEPVPRDPFRIPGLAVIVGEHGEMRPLLSHKRYDGPCWQSIEFDADQIKHVFPKPPVPIAQEWMSKNANKGQKRDSLLRDCRKATGCTKRDAEAAYKELPEELRRPRGKPIRSCE
jgi:hypothetical protein